MPKPKQQKQDEALARNEAWAALDTLTKIDRLHRRRGFSQRQRERLMAPMVKRKKQIIADREATS